MLHRLTFPKEWIDKLYMLKLCYNAGIEHDSNCPLDSDDILFYPEEILEILDVWGEVECDWYDDVIDQDKMKDDYELYNQDMNIIWFTHESIVEYTKLKKSIPKGREEIIAKTDEKINTYLRYIERASNFGEAYIDDTTGNLVVIHTWVEAPARFLRCIQDLIKIAEEGIKAIKEVGTIEY